MTVDPIPPEPVEYFRAGALGGRWTWRIAAGPITPHFPEAMST